MTTQSAIVDFEALERLLERATAEDAHKAALALRAAASVCDLAAALRHPTEPVRFVSGADPLMGMVG